MLSRIKPVDKILLAKHLSLMLLAGVPLNQSILEMQSEASAPFLKKILKELSAEIKSGKTVAATLAKHEKAFGPLFVNMIKIGEESGTLEESLKHLAAQLEKNYELKKKIKGAMMYPVLVLGATITIGLGLAIFVLPKLLVFFKSLDFKLPLITRIVLATIGNLEKYGTWYIAGAIGFVVLLKALLKLPKFKLFFDHLLTEMPIFGKIIKKMNMAYFTRTLATLLKSGVNIVEALSISAATLNNSAYKSVLEKAASEVRKGKNLGSFLKQNPRLVPSMVTKMVEIGERSGNLETTLFYVADFYEKEVDEISKNLADILEPILLIGVGLMVAVLAISILMPIYQFTSSIGQTH